MSLARSILFAVVLMSLSFVFGCGGGDSSGSIKASQQIQKLTAEKTDLQNQLDSAKAQNAQTLKQAEMLAQLPGEKRADALYHIKAIKIGKFTNFYDEDKTPLVSGKKKLVVYVEPIDDTGDTVKAGGAVEIQLWNLNKKENEARLGQWQIEPNELKTRWLSGMLSSGYRFSFDAAAIVSKFDEPLTVKVNFTDYLSGGTFTEQFVIRPPQPAGKK
jgi:hypothetical protein